LNDAIRVLQLNWPLVFSYSLYRWRAVDATTIAATSSPRAAFDADGGRRDRHRGCL
jgi:hypothetical protein